MNGLKLKVLENNFINKGKHVLYNYDGKTKKILNYLGNLIHINIQKGNGVHNWSIAPFYFGYLGEQIKNTLSDSNLNETNTKNSSKFKKWELINTVPT